MLEKPTAAAQVNFRNWRVVAVDYVVVGQMRRVGSKLTVQVQLLDVLRANVLQTWTVEAPDSRRLRPVAHHIADLVYEKLTGVPGYFNSQIAYVAATGQGKYRQFEIIVADADGINPTPVSKSNEPLLQRNADAPRLQRGHRTPTGRADRRRSAVRGRRVLPAQKLRPHPRVPQARHDAAYRQP